MSACTELEMRQASRDLKNKIVVVSYAELIIRAVIAEPVHSGFLLDPKFCFPLRSGTNTTLRPNFRFRPETEHDLTQVCQDLLKTGDNE